MVQVVKWGSETKVSNSGTFLSSTSAVSSQTGTTVTAYVSPTDNSVRISVHDFRGSPVGSADQLVGTGGLAGNNPAPTLTALSNGQFLVTWHVLGAQTSEVRAQLIYADGTLSSSSRIISGTIGAAQKVMSVTALDDALDPGRFEVAWSNKSVSTFSASLFRVGSDFSWNTGSTAIPGAAEIVALTSGKSVVAYSNYIPGSLNIPPFYGITINFMDNVGRQASAPMNVISSTGPVSEISISALLSDRFVITWRTSSGELRGQVFNSSGGKAASEFLIGTTGPWQQSDPETTVLSDGRFVVTWVDTSLTGGDTSGTAIRAQVFYADGRKYGAELLVNTSTTGSQVDPHVSAFQDGRFVISWTDKAGDANGASIIRSQIFDPREPRPGDNFVRWTGSDKAEAYAGHEGDDYLQGQGGNDKLSGEGGNDKLVAGNGLDTLLGGSGDDVLVVEDSGYNDVLDGGEGFDIVEIHHQGNSSLVVDLMTGNNNFYGTLISIEGFIGGDSSNDKISGSDVANDLRGRGGNDTLTGLLGNDTLDGGDGDDIIDGGAGRDRMDGGFGDDVYYVDDFTDIVVEEIGAGKDTVYASSSYDMTYRDNIEYLIGVGSDDIALTGNVLDNVIKGNAGNNRLDGTFGSDTLIGGAGNDTYVVRDSYLFPIPLDPKDAYITIREDADNGIDTILTELGGYLPDHVENMRALNPRSTLPMELMGNNLSNHLVGNDGDNYLFTGRDSTFTSQDTLEGGKGNDVYYVVYPNNAIIVEKRGEGTDTVQIELGTFTLNEGAEIELIRVTGAYSEKYKPVVTGNSWNQTIEGTNGADILDGGGGRDTLIGSWGADTYHVRSLDDVIVEIDPYPQEAYREIDTIIAHLDYTLRSEVSIEILRADDEAGSLSLTGNFNANTLVGNDSGNTLAGGGGLDTLKGGEGNDRFEVDTDDVVEDAGGRDTLVAMVSGVYTLAGGIENGVAGAGIDGIQLIGNGSANLLAGNILSNALSGESGDDDLRGREGDDVLSGGEGDDVLEGGAGADQLIGGAGIDTAVYADAKTKLTISLDDTTRNTGEAAGDTFSSIENIIGSDYDDVLIGSNGAANTLSGGLGDDTLIGMGGNDVLKGGGGQNTAVYEGSFSSYTIVAQADGSLRVSDSVKSRGGTDILVDVQELKFADQMFRTANREPTALALSASMIKENALASTIVATLSADDKDGDAIRYTLVSSDGPFRIDGNNLVLTGGLDYESKTQHTVTIKAHNGYGAGTTQTFTFDILDVFEPATVSGADAQGNQILRGRSADDRLKGGDGNDKLYGGAGKDVLTGGLGQDIFVFDTKPGKKNVDRIADFKVKDDTIHLAKSVFKKMAKKGVIKTNEFYQGTKANDKDDHVIYNKKTGALYYDADGTGSQAQVQIATLSKNLKMTYKDFFVI
ncbi:cadherin domain-containing protein [Microvirga sp. 2YAF29]|uniref:cadherin domain-containing protein n=1 Tax=Microvirga sp. 2YAF29 TaxID=3233031 RepID=UPI003F989173